MRLRSRCHWISLVTGVVVLIVGSDRAPGQSPAQASDLIVHEWGTFLAVQGSDGATLDGMYHEEHALPGFVHARSRDQLRLPTVWLKGETPVIYFYTNRPQNVSVSVSFPRGIWTQWYPQALLVSPGLASLGSELELRDGRIAWGVEVVPNAAGVKPPPLPATSADALWNFARSVDAAYVRSVDRARKGTPSEYERFIFYRGLGQATLPLAMAPDAGGSLTASGNDADGVRHAFVLRVENGQGSYRYLPELRVGQTVTQAIPSLDDALPLEQFTEKVANELAARLVESGLFSKEARAMVNTWRTSYFHTDGIRVLFILPQKWTDAFIPLQIYPTPKQVARVMVGRLEVLTPEREGLAESAVRDLASPDAGARERALGYLQTQGRYVEPIVRRVLAKTTNESVRSLCRRLLLTDFVSEIRTALKTAGDGAQESPLFVRAKLASLLREIGLDAEAKAEAEPVAAELEKILELSPGFANSIIETKEGRVYSGIIVAKSESGVHLGGSGGPAAPIPRQSIQQIKLAGMTNHEARHYLRAYARAMEGLGNDAAAADEYGRFILFASQVKQGGQCTNCHRAARAPTDMAWFRDWWAGKKYAQAVTRIDKLDETISDCESRLRERPNDTAAQMMLAYLYQARGDATDAERMWAAAGAASPKRNGPPGAVAESSRSVPRQR